jgi:hypothetical protein
VVLSWLAVGVSFTVWAEVVATPITAVVGATTAADSSPLEAGGWRGLDWERICLLSTHCLLLRSPPFAGQLTSRLAGWSWNGSRSCWWSFEDEGQLFYSAMHLPQLIHPATMSMHSW